MRASSTCNQVNGCICIVDGYATNVKLFCGVDLVVNVLLGLEVDGLEGRLYLSVHLDRMCDVRKLTIAAAVLAEVDQIHRHPKAQCARYFYCGWAVDDVDDGSPLIESRHGFVGDAGALAQDPAPHRVRGTLDLRTDPMQ